mgnify:CR=1 FL=1
MSVETIDGVINGSLSTCLYSIAEVVAVDDGYGNVFIDGDIIATDSGDGAVTISGSILAECDDSGNVIIKNKYRTMHDVAGTLSTEQSLSGAISIGHPYKRATETASAAISQAERRTA